MLAEECALAGLLLLQKAFYKRMLLLCRRWTPRHPVVTADALFFLILSSFFLLLISLSHQILRSLFLPLWKQVRKLYHSEQNGLNSLSTTFCC